MRRLQRYQGETTRQWLARLYTIDPTALSRHGRFTLTLSISYARYLIEKGIQEIPVGKPALLGAQGRALQFNLGGSR